MAIIRAFNEFHPSIHSTAFLAENATIIGEVEIGEDASIWYGAVLRGDVGAIQIGARSNIQDLCTVHCTTNHSKTIVGEDVTVGHNAVLHGCIIESCALVGMGAIIMDNAVVQEDTIVAAGAVVLENQVLQRGYLYAGTPAKQIKPLTAAQVAGISQNASHYVEMIAHYRHP